MTLDIGTILPTSTPDPARPILGDVRAAARLAEEVGLDSVWSTDHLLASAPILESTGVVATAAAVTDRIRVGYGVLLLALRPTAWAAKQVATLQYLSGDRILLGIGTGNPAHGDIGWRAAGQSFADRGRRTDEALAILPDLIAGRPATLPDGTEATLSPGATVPPILVAGDAPAALRRAATYADGWIAMNPSPDELPSTTTRLADLAAERNRPTPAVTVVAALPSDLSEATDRTAAYVAAGAERVIIAPHSDDWRATYEFAAKVKSAL
ncbi:alkanesulfonate monooxygenase SsuD/methylene tetrahydromethanopterin reductase-like flavin-dependent oxidoreductase (luciferase family) [Nocardia transvalensis]|uniref:Alkanesulfonate monooxygenase SsuD/methylene tetrahydromethanopterin reductase-like flavin-dependent oxidoreductase (Luciferase family) n=1 Tax=Nocardia transvalensis TaxID=37333 RepID=A0A7W9PEI5_9NOCA|nr:LLM class flavin-dependent oxidoreductase [Nocardia transvalensis]MBB5914189.1 alkanesulfonate monooxygenase SsuD/methylene tetrahydromethanopterin reductase-like flavin-dependent oxidoreductase (luciferase family) [Nocardia transvalensis]